LITKAVVMSEPGSLSIQPVDLKSPTKEDVVIKINYSGISTGTEKLFYNGKMPQFPGMGYPLVPGYESTGEVVQAPKDSNLKIGDMVFVPGADCYSGSVKSLFGGAARMIISAPNRLIKIDSTMGCNGALFALAATARHAIAGFGNKMPDVIVGHGVLGRLLARLVILAGEKPPIVWEKNILRHSGATDYEVVLPEYDERSDYDCIFDVSGDSEILDSLIGRVRKGGEVVLAGFYPERLGFGFAQAFLKEVSLRVSAEFTPEDVATTKLLIEDSSLSFDGLISDVYSAKEANEAYNIAFNNAECLKMVLDWRNAA
jgi:3-hydroxyethyl bacteriochlorophyllide a dehydrogenase